MNDNTNNTDNTECECVICLEPVSNNKNFKCKKCKNIFHSKCIYNLIEKECPLCRENIILQKHLPRNDYIEWLINGGEPMYRWRTKKHRKRYKQSLKYKYS